MPTAIHPPGDRRPGTASSQGSQPHRLIRLAASSRPTVVLLILLAGYLALGALAPEEMRESFLKSWGGGGGLGWARLLGLMDTWRSPPFLLLVLLLAGNIAVCTLRRIPAGRPPRALVLDLLLHLSLVVILAGALVKGFAGFAATGYLFLGQEGNVVYDTRLRRDVTLPFSLVLLEKRVTFHPAQVQVGVSLVPGGEKVALLEAREGEPVGLPGSGAVLELAAEPQREGAFRLRVREGADLREGLLAAGGAGGVEVGGRRYTLVAYRQDLKESAALVAPVEGGRRGQPTWLDPRHLLVHRGHRVSMVGWGADEFGNRFVSIQVFRDPGAILFWIGAWLLAAALPLFLVVRHRERGDRSRG